MTRKRKSKRTAGPDLHVTVAGWRKDGGSGWCAVLSWGSDARVRHVVSGWLATCEGCEAEAHALEYALEALCLPARVGVYSQVRKLAGVLACGGGLADLVRRRTRSCEVFPAEGVAWSLARKLASNRATDGRELVRDVVRAKEVANVFSGEYYEPE